VAFGGVRIKGLDFLKLGRAFRDPALKGFIRGLKCDLHELALGDVDTLHKNAHGIAENVRNRLIDEIEKALVDRAAGYGLHCIFETERRIGLAAAIDIVEEIDKALPGGFGKRLGDGAAQHGSMPHEFEIARVHQFEHMFRSAQHRHESRSLFEKLREPLPFGRENSVGDNLVGGFDADAEQTCDSAVFLPARCI
jgi:hypothetical protein